MLQSTPPPLHLHLHLWTEAETGNGIADRLRRRPRAPYRALVHEGAPFDIKIFLRHHYSYFTTAILWDTISSPMRSLAK